MRKWSSFLSFTSSRSVEVSWSITTGNGTWNVSHCLTYFSLLWVLVFRLSSHTQCKFASPQNCQKWLSLLPSKSVYGLLSLNHSLKQNDWFPNPSSSSVIFNRHFSPMSFKEKIIALLHIAGLSGNNTRREGTWELCSLFSIAIICKLWMLPARG